MPYINSVNSHALTIHVVYVWKDEFGHNRPTFASVKIPAYSGRIMGITINPSKRNGIAYHANELEIEIDKLFTWRLDILDRGYATLDEDLTFGETLAGGDDLGVVVTNADVSADGFQNREPVLLDGMGQALNIKKIDGVYLRYGVYPELDWRIVGLDRPKNLQGAN
jgi:hypothetical protein